MPCSRGRDCIAGIQIPSAPVHLALPRHRCQVRSKHPRQRSMATFPAVSPSGCSAAARVQHYLSYTGGAQACRRRVLARFPALLCDWRHPSQRCKRDMEPLSDATACAFQTAQFQVIVKMDRGKGRREYCDISKRSKLPHGRTRKARCRQQIWLTKGLLYVSRSRNRAPKNVDLAKGARGTLRALIPQNVDGECKSARAYTHSGAKPNMKGSTAPAIQELTMTQLRHSASALEKHVPLGILMGRKNTK
ncbi:hypothetical protein TRVL_08964 [Trypanosoma vivax]|nr:hypothetical protein TRVL_08964 [Trypanosoma vivax]